MQPAWRITSRLAFRTLPESGAVTNLLAVLIAGLAVGSVYGLMALAVNVTFAARRVVNFAHGDVTMLGGLVAVTVIVGWGLPYFVGVLAAIVATVLVALAIERVAIRPLPRDETSIAWILSILAVSIILSNISLLTFGPEPKQFPSLFSDRPVELGGINVVPDQIATIVAAGLFMLLFHFVQNRTIRGKALKAVASDPAMASLLGIGVDWYIGGAFALSGVMATIAAILVGPMTFVSSQLGFVLGIKGFAAATLGGLGTFRGAVAGGVLLGVVEALTALYAGSSYKDSISLVILGLILILRPGGLLGEVRVSKM